MTQEYLSVVQGAAHIGMKEKAFRKWLERGKIPYRKLGHRVLIPRADLEEFLAGLPGKTAKEALTAVGEGDQVERA